MKAIVTKYLGPTNSRGSRIKASDEDGNSITIPYDYALDSEGRHLQAAQAFCTKMNWTGELVAGSVKNGYVFVFANWRAKTGHSSHAIKLDVSAPIQ